MNITVWNEFAHEKSDPKVKAIYPDGIHAVIAAFLRDAGHEVRTATLDDPECGLTDEVLDFCKGYVDQIISGKVVLELPDESTYDFNIAQ